MSAAQTYLDKLSATKFFATALAEKAVKLFSKLPENLVSKMSTDPVTYIKEHRTIGIIVPRQSGKSTYLRHLQKQNQSMLFMARIHENRSNRSDHIYEFQEITSLAIQFRGKRPEPFKYFLIDESRNLRGDNEYDFWQFVGFMHTSGFLAPDFFVLKMTT